MQGKYRQASRESFIKWDCGTRVQKAYLRNAVPVPGPYKEGDIISYCRRNNIGNTIQWSIGCKIVGFERDPNYPDKDPNNAWVICDGISVLVALDKIRPCAAAELLAYQAMQGNDIPRAPVFETHIQQSFIDERGSKRRNVAPEPPDEFQTPRGELGANSSSSANPFSAKELRASAKELRADEPMATPPRAQSPSPTERDDDLLSSPRKRGEPDEGASLSEACKRNKVIGKGVELLDKIAYLIDEEQSLDKDRVGFLQVRLAAPRAKKTAAKKPKKKDGDKNLHFASSSPEIQQGLRHSRAAEWQKWKKFNAGVILTKDELRELQDAGVKLYPMQ